MKLRPLLLLALIGLPACTTDQVNTTLETFDALRPAIIRATTPAKPASDKNPLTVPAPQKAKDK